jgi:transposase-like protein
VIKRSTDALAWLRKHLETADTDLRREMVRSFAEALMGADADAVCGAPQRRDQPGAGEPPSRPPDPLLGHTGRQ